MKAQLAMRLLAELMNWDETRATREFAWLRLMVASKFDHYQGYIPGAHFYVNLLAWIGQFDENQRETAYGLIRQRLIYVCQREMHHLVSLTMPQVQDEIRRDVAQQMGVPYYRTWGDAEAERRIHLVGLRTLYVALSDGAKIDVFRRENEGVISNEQVVASSEISTAKWEKLTKELTARLKAEGFADEDALFERICLIDDFTASGTTLIRFDAEGPAWKGKISTFCDQNRSRFGKQIAEGCVLHVHHYLASHAATSITQDTVSKFSAEMGKFKFLLTFSFVLDDDIVISDKSDSELVSLLKDHYDPSIEDDIVGKDIWFGYKRCGLPLVLYHNTPNNSVALLWASSTARRLPTDVQMKPLFTRKKRHIGNG